MKALITGITGQDGSYLAELLLSKGYEVHGLVRRVALERPESRLTRINHIKDKLKLHPGLIQNYVTIFNIIQDVKPDEIYHLAAQSFVAESFDDPFSTFEINVKGTHNLLESAKRSVPNAKIYFAASSEIFGKVHEIPQKETTKLHPRSPYGITKVTGFHLVQYYREAFGIFGCSGILFNHESPRRGFEFVTRKITQTVARMKHGKTNVLVMGNIDAKRDWGFAGDYVEMMWTMLQQETPDDYLVASGESHSVKEFIDEAFKIASLSYELIDLHEYSDNEADAKVDELKKHTSKLYVVKHPKYYRPAEVDILQGDMTKARTILKWQHRVTFKELIKMMVEHDIICEGNE
jgi:GDPmannose 4,6-dehydratase